MKTLFAFFLTIVAAPAFALDAHGPYTKLNDNLYVGTFCHISTGTSRTLVKTILGLAKITGIPSELTDLGVNRATMNKGDGMCIWMNVNHPKTNRLTGTNDFSRRHLVTSRTSERVRGDTKYMLKLYGSDKKLIAEKTGTCNSHTRCWTDVLQGNGGSSGIAVCLEPVFSGKTISLVLAQGTTPGAQTNSSVADKTCETRKAEF